MTKWKVHNIPSQKENDWEIIDTCDFKEGNMVMTYGGGYGGSHAPDSISTTEGTIKIENILMTMHSLMATQTRVLVEIRDALTYHNDELGVDHSAIFDIKDRLDAIRQLLETMTEV